MGWVRGRVGGGAATSPAQHSREAPADQPREQPQEAEALPAPSPAHVLPLGEVLGVCVSWAEFRTGLSENGYGVCVCVGVCV